MDETGAENKPKDNGVYESSRKKGEREAEDADIGLKERPQAGSGATTIVQCLGTRSNYNSSLFHNRPQEIQSSHENSPPKLFTESSHLVSIGL